MPLNPTLSDIVLRLALACLAGALIGYNREARNEAAGLRTTVLVCLAACVAMLLANLLLPTDGKQHGSFAQIDVLRLPLGILSGMGFLGAGAIIKRGDSVLGVTTAATLWFMTVVGLCFGAGQFWLGIAATVLALATVWGLKWADEHMHRKQVATLTVRADRQDFPEAELRQRLAESAFVVLSWTITYCEAGTRYEAIAQLQWEGHDEHRTRTPPIIEQLASARGVTSTEWKPQDQSA